MYSLINIKKKFHVYKMCQSVWSHVVVCKIRTFSVAICSLPPVYECRYKGSLRFLAFNVNHVKVGSFFTSDIMGSRFLSTTYPLLKKKKAKKLKAVRDQEYSETQNIDVLFDNAFDTWKSNADNLGFLGSQGNYRFNMGVLVLQPWVKWGPKMKKKTTPDLMLDEASSLIATLPGIRVIHKEVVPVHSTDSKTMFGSGTLARLVTLAQSLEGVTSVFVNTNMLKNIQVEALQAAFGLKVVDRYSVVLGIFRLHARTKEAKLQIALAELPYIKKRMDWHGDKERLMMMNREKHLQNALDTIASNRAHIRRSRQKLDIPSVAVVGYTNAGKTSLIHAISGDSSAEGKDHLFATLDVTAHGCKLPCGVDIVLIDTVGFIQEIPTELIASFRATFEDAVCADVVVHVRDANHPDYVLQGIIVEETLSSLPIPETTPVITVANKIDLVTNEDHEDFGDLQFVSCMTGEGLEDLLLKIESQVLKVTGRKFWRFTLPTGSDEISWLRKETGLVSQETDKGNPQVTHVIAVMTDQEIAAYKRNFRK